MLLLWEVGELLEEAAADAGEESLVDPGEWTQQKPVERRGTVSWWLQEAQVRQQTQTQATALAGQPEAERDLAQLSLPYHVCACFSFSFSFCLPPMRFLQTVVQPLQLVRTVHQGTAQRALRP